VLHEINPRYKLVPFTQRVKTYYRQCATTQEDPPGYRLSLTRSDWSALKLHQAMVGVLHYEHPSHKRDDLLQVDVEVASGSPLLDVCKALKIASMRMVNICTSNNKELLCSVRAGRQANQRDANAAAFGLTHMKDICVEHGMEVWQRAGSFRVLLDETRYDEIKAKLEENGLLFFSDVPKSWRNDLVRMHGVAALPPQQPTDSSPVAIKAMGPVSSIIMREAAASINAKLRDDKWSPTQCVIEFQEGTKPPLPHVFDNPKFAGLIVDYEMRF
jgi:hypothetical protein